MKRAQRSTAVCNSRVQIYLFYVYSAAYLQSIQLRSGRKKLLAGNCRCCKVNCSLRCGDLTAHALKSTLGFTFSVTDKQESVRVARAVSVEATSDPVVYLSILSMSEQRRLKEPLRVR